MRNKVLERLFGMPFETSRTAKGNCRSATNNGGGKRKINKLVSIIIFKIIVKKIKK